jgi:hypothetical protein
MTQAQEQATISNWKPYKLDRYAQNLVLDRRDLKDVLNESHKMRMAVGYGLERFWGEHIRLQRESREKAAYWKAVWDQLADILTETGCTIVLPKDTVGPDDTAKIKRISGELWALEIDDQRVALMVLTQFCDALVWWTQRYKKPSSQQPSGRGGN